jgi:amidohydrolase
MHKLIRDKASALYQKVLATRKKLHMHPELSFKEYNTMQFVSNRLKELNIPHQSGIAGTGIVAFIQGNHSENTPHIVMRADLDALPIQEMNECDYKSKVDGVMHACGHDVHTSVLLGTAELLKSMDSELLHPVQLIFQPGEEKAPGGASLMIEAGALKMRPIKSMYALHVFPEMNAGNVGFKSGLYMASCDEIHIKIIGKGGHAAMPHQCIDPIQTGAQLVRELPLNLHKKCDPKIPMVLSFGHFEALGATNVIPDTAIIKGTFRTMNEEWRSSALEFVINYINKLSESTGAKLELTIVKGYPYLENDPETTEELRGKAQELLGLDKVHELPIRLTAEDFSYYTHHVPSCFFRLGVRNEELGIIHGVHHPKFDIDPKAMITGMEVLSLTALT